MEESADIQMGESGDIEPVNSPSPTVPNIPRVFQLAGACNNYSWGRMGRLSLAARLCEQTPGTGFVVYDSKPYSEMWFGDYPDYPARRLATGELLQDVLARNQETLLGRKVMENFGGQLPFLPKILSIAKVLPLQIHPNKELARKLHEENPSKFTDPNHKPEILVALGPFEIFAGFRPLEEIQELFSRNPLWQFVPEINDDVQWTDAILREVTRRLLEADPETVKTVQVLLSELPRSQLGASRYILDVLPRLQKQYPGDAGSLVALLCMNLVRGEEGNAIYIPADGIHAYLSGDMVECMARSNNVLNAGCCPPADRDNIDLFTDTLTFRTHSLDDLILRPEWTDRGLHGKTLAYSPPMSEFDMLKIDLSPGEFETLAASDGPGVLIVTKGAGLLNVENQQLGILKEGYIFFVAPGVTVKFISSHGLQIHMAVV